MKNKTKPQIKNLNDLRMAKKLLKSEMKFAENKQENSLLNKAFNLASTFSSDQNFASSKIENSLHRIGNKASEKYPMKGFSKIIISGLIVLAVPLITAKVQSFINEKLQ